ncbi:circularly permuted type 2 ATP-grasp protein [Terrimonas pollutisoli]|uniref:circularly permuted type 2 ATP-grasp protein n=1 Tax=Terrimonas pollutisoli TaxID=3034147 RepID=UPI0023EE01C0|nr:circularly permuted type 2 ATP-grasp protein [Terrimonas sp. H1YJ31]
MSDQSTVHSLLQQYIPALSSYNELFSDDNNIRPDWQTFFSSLHELGYKELQNRNIDILRLLKENGVAYNIYNDPSGQSRPWELDPIPQLITANEWETINAGLIQRAELFNLLLKDIYGPQTLIKNGIIPQELIYLHPGFLRSCVNIKLPGTQHLVLYAADMARGIDGRLWIISDRTQAPSGSGYALENRFAMSSVLPELFSNLQVKRLSPYFDSLQQALTNIAPRNNDNPRVVVLTPGPDNETYFEHSYLAAYLGLTLVQGNDLMVKDNYVWLKTIDGLEKVDVILRRLDDVYCDPLELKSDSLLGIPGLVQVVRKGNIAIANPLGSSIVESAGLVPFLPAVAQHFFGTELIMPSIATWWCGQPKELNYVIDNLKTLVVRKIFRNVAGTRSAIDGASLPAAQADELILEIKANPHLYVGQEKISFSSTPSWLDGTIVAGHSLFRSFLVSHNNSYVAMPGGLTRTKSGENSFVISNQLGGISKDTWVLSADEEQEQPVSLQLNTDALQHKLIKRSLPSHTAENLFWVGRYTERVIYNARLQRTVMQRMLQSNKPFNGDNESTETVLLQTLTQCTYTFPGFFEDSDPQKRKEIYAKPWTELTDVLYNEKRNGSLSHNLSLLKTAVYSVRNFWALDTWRVLRQMEEEWNKAKADTHADHLRMISTIDSLNTSMFAFLGMNRESVRREQGWNIMDLGRKLEQTLYIISLLRSVFQKKQKEQVEHELLESVMIASQSLITYRYTYRDHLQLPLALELLMLDTNYPKSLAYLVKKIKRYISLLPKEGKEIQLSDKQRNIQEADSLLKLADTVALTKYDPDSKEYVALTLFLDKLYSLIADTSMLISKTYFKHSQTQKQLFTANLI